MRGRAVRMAFLPKNKPSRNQNRKLPSRKGGVLQKLNRAAFERHRGQHKSHSGHSGRIEPKKSQTLISKIYFSKFFSNETKYSNVGDRRRGRTLFSDPAKSNGIDWPKPYRSNSGNPGNNRAGQTRRGFGHDTIPDAPRVGRLKPF